MEERYCIVREEQSFAVRSKVPAAGDVVLDDDDMTDIAESIHYRHERGRGEFLDYLINLVRYATLVGPVEERYASYRYRFPAELLQPLAAELNSAYWGIIALPYSRNDGNTTDGPHPALEQAVLEQFVASRQSAA